MSGIAIRHCRPFLVLEATPHHVCEGRVHAYGPYVREMNLWAHFAGPTIVLAPVSSSPPSPADLPYETEHLALIPLPAFSIINLREAMRTLKLLPGVAARILAAMRRAGHIHLRCPSNVGLIGLALQVFFPNKPKTIKYAGNWQSYPGEPWSYRLQKCLARNSVWCRSSRVLAYGPSHSGGSHVVSAFAATYHEADARIPVSPRPLSREQEIRFLFVGTLAPNKRPLLAVEVCRRLKADGIPARLDLFGDGPERQKVEKLIRSCKAGDAIHCHGNLPLEVLTDYYRKSHFLLMLSESEGWPKAMTEGMFWGTVPIATPVSCVPMILGHGKRGALVEPTAEDVRRVVLDYLEGRRDYQSAAEAAAHWSRRYTLEALSELIRGVLDSLAHEGTPNC